MEKLAEGYREIYEAAAEEGTLDTLEAKQQILSCLEREGYAAVDREDQLNMVNSDKMEAFCLDAQAGKQAEVVLLSLIEEGGFVRYDLTAEDGKIQVHLSTLAGRTRNRSLLSPCVYRSFLEVHGQGLFFPGRIPAFRL